MLNDLVKCFFLTTFLYPLIFSRQVCQFDPERASSELVVSSERCAKMEFQLMFPKFEPIRFYIRVLNSSCLPERDVITHVDFNGCRIANVHSVFTGTTKRLEVFKQVGTGDEVATTVYNKENVEYSVNKTALHLNNGYDDILPPHCHGIFKLNKQSQIVIPVTVQFSESTCAVEVDFVNGIPQVPEKRKFSVPDRAEPHPRPTIDPSDKSLADRKIQALDSEHFSRYDDETLFVSGSRNDPNSYWKLFASLSASMVFLLVGIGYFIVTKLRPDMLGRLKPNTMSFSNPNIELSSQPGSAEPEAAPTSTNQVIFSSGGVIFKNMNTPHDDYNANSSGFSNRLYEQTL